MIKSLINLLLPFKKELSVLFLIVLCSSFFESFGIALLLPIIENIIGEKDTSSLTGIIYSLFNKINIEPNLINSSVFFIFILVLKNIFKMGTTFMNTKIVFMIRKSWMLSINNYYMRGPYSEIIKNKQGFLVNNMVFETQKGAMGILKVNEFFIALTMMLSYTFLLLITNAQLALVLFTIFGLSYLLFSALGKNILADYGRNELKLNQDTNSIAAEGISALRQVRTFSIEKKNQSILKGYLEKLTRISVNYELIKTFPKILIEIALFTVIFLIVLYFESNNESNIRYYLPTISIFIFALQRLLGNFNKIISTKYSFDFYRPTFELIDTLISKKSYMKVSNKYKIEKLRTDIIFKDVSFQYDQNESVLRHININIKRGKITAIYGESGSGKSTLADLILGLYRPTKGKIYINDTNLKDVNIESWRNCIGFISQDNYLFHDTIIENIRIGNSEAKENDIIEAVKQAQAYDFIKKLPNQFNTIVGDRGIMLSGGQKQRIAIARAILRNPDLLIFDEATSALDNKTENKMLDLIFEMAHDKTVIFITHKPQIIKRVDYVLNLENGGIKLLSND